MCSPSPPPAPDYSQAAKDTAAGNLETARYTTEANRVNQVTPYGNLTYTKAPDVTDQAGYDAALNRYNNEYATYEQQLNQYNQTGQQGVAPSMVGSRPNIKDFTKYGNEWTATQTLAPEQQALLDANNKLSGGLMGAANTGLDYARGVIEKPGVDMSRLAQTGINPGEGYRDAMMRQLQPQIEQDRNALGQNLANQGIGIGSEAWRNAQQQQGDNESRMRNQAVIGGMQTGLAANQQGFNQQSYNQMQPINVINALRTGSQVSQPNYVNPSQQQGVPGADMLGAMGQIGADNRSRYSADVASNNAMWGGLMGAGATLGGAALLRASDRRLKDNIIRIGTHALGIGLYAWDYIWGEHSWGVMADEVLEVMPEAVITHPDGYLMVDYGMIGGR